MISTTGKPPRNDAAGGGTYLSKRGSKLHAALDEQVTPGQDVVAPISGKVTRYAYPYEDKTYSGIKIQGDRMAIKMWYFVPDPEVMGREVKAGDKVGVAQDITLRYPGQGMTPHIHVEVESIDPLLLMEAASV